MTSRRWLAPALLVLSACTPGGLSSTLDEAGFDAASADAGRRVDAGAADAGEVDAGADADAVGPDAGGADASADAGPADAGAVGTCGREGGSICGIDVGGAPDVLYTCRGGLRVPRETCAEGCDRMPPGVPDRCRVTITEIPPELIELLSTRPYVEQDCARVDHPGWPYRALRCSYCSGTRCSTVVTASPAPERVARWVIDASRVIPALDRLRESDRASWLAGLRIIARRVMTQSSRIFPLEGGIIENLGSGWVDYPFRMGVTDGCSTGCYCRINGLHRTQLCSYQEAMSHERYDACLERVGSRGLTSGWGNQCQGNHERAWRSDTNEHFRALAWVAQRALVSRCGSRCTASDVLEVLRSTHP